MITNLKNLAKNPLRKKALLIAEAAYSAIEITRVIQKKITLKKNQLIINLASINGSKKLKLNINDYQRIFLVGIGKGSALASAALAQILGKHLATGIVLDIQRLKTKNLKLKTYAGTHPLPSIRNIKATQKIIEWARGLTEKDLLIAFICGGGSALSCASEKELKQFILVTKELTKAGADIVELNTVRKHLSDFKGGGLAKIAYPATVISLIVSDVLGNDLNMVASGPTVMDKTSKTDAQKVLKKYRVKLRLNFQETPKNRKYFRKVRNILFVSNKDAVSAMEKQARQLKLNPKIYSLALRGEAKKSLLPLIKKIKSGEVILAAGETTVMLETSDIRHQKLGKGGRNQEAVLGALANNQLLMTNDLVVMSFASDGRDNTEAAGAIADFRTIKKVKKLKLDPQKFLNNHNSFSFFRKTGDLIFAKPKSFNVADLMLVLRDSK